MKVEIISHTENPDLVIATAAKLCYAGCDIDELMKKQTQESIDLFISKLEMMGHCYDEETEVLTDNGFVKWNDFLIHTMKIAAIDPKTRVFKSFEKPSNFICRDVNEELIRYNDNNIDLLITDRHKIYCSLSNTQQARINPSFSLIEAKDIYNKPMRMVKSAINSNNEILNNDILFALYGFFIGDGYADPNSRNQLKFHLKLDRKIEYLKNICNELGYSLIEQSNNKFIVEHENIAKIFREMFYNKNNEKTFPNKFYSISANQFNYFLDGLKNSDGSIKRNTWTYSSTSEELINRLQALGSINNTVFSIQKNQNNVFRLNLNSRTLMPHLNDSRKNIYAHKETYTGKVYCATVSTGLLIVRRNGIVSLCGNCSPFEHASFTFAIEGISRVCEQQFTRHRIASYSIQSGRYVDRSNANFYVPGDIKDCEDAFEIYSTVIESTKDAYQKITEALLHHYIIQYDLKTNFMEQECKYSKGNYYENAEGCIRYFKHNHKKEYSKMHKKAIENARNIFPNSLETKMIVTMNVRSLWNFFKHRSCFRAQDEIRELSLIMLKLLKSKFPTLFKHAGASCKSGICPENSMQCEQLKGKIPTMNDVKILIANHYNKKEPIEALD